MFKTIIAIIILVTCVSCSTTHYYVVRHAEKEVANQSMMTTDVPLSAAGMQRAESLKDKLQNKNISHIFSTNYIRTIATAKPFSDATGVKINIYNPGSNAFIDSLKTIKKGNVLVVGHSNTVDDIVNKLIGVNHLQDLPDSQYGDLFIIKKKNRKYSLSKERFGK